MYDTYKRIGDVDGCRYERGVLDGLERAIEVANNMEKRRGKNHKLPVTNYESR